jgi:hypothetical protein
MCVPANKSLFPTLLWLLGTSHGAQCHTFFNYAIVSRAEPYDRATHVF